MTRVEFLQFHHEAPSKGYWDQTLLMDLLPDKTAEDKAIVIIPGADQEEYIDKINNFLIKYPKVLVIITSDEEAKLPIDKLEHPNMTLWGTYMNDKYKVDKWLPIGYTPHRNVGPVPEKTLNFFFAGQITHLDREKMVDALSEMPNGELIQTDGFAKGLPPEEYTAGLLKAKYAPCPAGGVNTDSFRVYEALEAGCIPITRDKSFWYDLFPDAPFPVLDDWSELSTVLSDDYDVKTVLDWWRDYKDKLKSELKSWSL